MSKNKVTVKYWDVFGNKSEMTGEFNSIKNKKLILNLEDDIQFSVLLSHIIQVNRI